MKEFIFERRVQYHETDKMGIVHHSNYIKWFEESRIKYMEEMGLPYKTFEENGMQIPVLSVYCEYKMPVTFDDVVQIFPIMKEFLGVRMAIDYKIQNRLTKELVAIGQTKHCFVDKDMRPIILKKFNPEIYEKFSKWFIIN